MTNPNTAPFNQHWCTGCNPDNCPGCDPREQHGAAQTGADSDGGADQVSQLCQDGCAEQALGGAACGKKCVVQVEAVAPEARADVLKQLRTAMDVVSALCDGSMRWTMSVPARPDSDPDLVISGALHAAEKLIAAAPPAPPAPLDVCTDARNCPRCAAHPNLREGLHHVGIGFSGAAPLPGKESEAAILLRVIQRLNGNPYSLTKSECIYEVEQMRKAAISAQPSKTGE